MNNTVNWYEIQNFDYLKEAIKDYHSGVHKDQSPGNVEYHTDKMSAKDVKFM